MMDDLVVNVMSLFDLDSEVGIQLGRYTDPSFVLVCRVIRSDK